jgi:hypothetical protein
MTCQTVLKTSALIWQCLPCPGHTPNPAEVVFVDWQRVVLVKEDRTGDGPEAISGPLLLKGVDDFVDDLLVFLTHSSNHSTYILQTICRIIQVHEVE